MQINFKCTYNDVARKYKNQVPLSEGQRFTTVCSKYLCSTFLTLAPLSETTGIKRSLLERKKKPFCVIYIR